MTLLDEPISLYFAEHPNQLCSGENKLKFRGICNHWFDFKPIETDKIQFNFETSRTSSKVALHSVKVLSSAKFNISEKLYNRSLMKILNKKGPKIDPWNTKTLKW